MFKPVVALPTFVLALYLFTAGSAFGITLPTIHLFSGEPMLFEQIMQPWTTNIPVDI